MMCCFDFCFVFVGVDGLVVVLVLLGMVLLSHPQKHQNHHQTIKTNKNKTNNEKKGKNTSQVEHFYGWAFEGVDMGVKPF